MHDSGEKSTLAVPLLPYLGIGVYNHDMLCCIKSSPRNVGCCGKCSGVKLKSRIMKVWENTIIDRRQLTGKTSTDDYQFGRTTVDTETTGVTEGTSHLSPFSPFAAVSLCLVAGLAQISGSFLPDAPGFLVPPDRIIPPQLCSSSRALPLHLHFDNCSGVLDFVSSFGVAKPLQPSHNRRYLFHFRYLQDVPIPPVV